MISPIGNSERLLSPLERRTMFSRKVFCGATSPLRPPAITAGHALQCVPWPVNMKYPHTSPVSLSSTCRCRIQWCVDPGLSSRTPLSSTPLILHHRLNLRNSAIYWCTCEAAGVPMWINRWRWFAIRWLEFALRNNIHYLSNLLTPSAGG